MTPMANDQREVLTYLHEILMVLRGMRGELALILKALPTPPDARAYKPRFLGEADPDKDETNDSL